MNRFLILCFSLLSLIGQAQPYRLRAYLDENNNQIVRKESVFGTNVFDVPVGSLPSDAVRARIAGRSLLPYALEDKHTLLTSQFGSGKYYAPNYQFSVDFNLNQDNLAMRRAQGVSLFSRFVQPNPNEYVGLPSADKFYYQTENELHGAFEGAGVFENSLATLEQQYYNAIPSGMGHWTANIETSNVWLRRLYDEGAKGYDSWASAQNKVIVCEFDGVTRTLSQLDASGLWETEATIRRANRLAIMMTIARQRNTWASYGASMFQGEPRTNSLATTGVFAEGSADVSHIGGSGGNINLNGRAYSGIDKNVYAYENSMLDYFYHGIAQISQSDYNDIWVNKTAGTQTTPYIWSKLTPYHIVASEKGHWQANKYRMTHVVSQADRGSIRMQELPFEFSVQTPDYTQHGAFLPFTELQNTIVFGDYRDTPKLWLPPYFFYSAYTVHRFLEGSTTGSGYHLWNAPGTTLLPTSHPMYNHHLHSITALYQARADMQVYEKFYPGTTLVADPEVQLNSSGGFSSYSGADAFAFGPDGGRGVQKPAYILRYKPTSTGWSVVIVGGMVQGWTEERTDVIRVPNGGLNGNQFRIKLRGPSAQVYEFAVKNTDSGQTYDALPVAQTAWEKPGYGGRIGIGGAVTTPTSPTTTTPTTNTVVAYNQTFEAEEAAGSGNVYPKGEASKQGIKDGNLTYSVTSVPSAGSYSLVLTYQTNGTNQVSGTINGTPFSVNGTDGGLTFFNTTVNLAAGTNNLPIVITSGYMAQDKITISRTGTSGNIITPPVSTSYPFLARVAFLGNSITTHSASTAINWGQFNGMAASDEAHDQVHLLISALKTVNPNLDAIIMGQGSSFELSYLNTYSENDLTNVLTNINFDLDGHFGAGQKLDGVFLQISENINPLTFDETKFRTGLDRLFASLPLNSGATIVMRNSFWAGNNASNLVLQQYAQQHNYKFVNLDNIRERSDYLASSNQPPELTYTDAGVRHHPNNAGHAAIAQLTLAQLGTGSSTPTTPTTGSGQGVWAANSSYVAKSETGNRPGFTIPSYITNGTLRVGITPTAGDVITHVHEGQGTSWINNPIFNTNQAEGSLDVGRQMMGAAYGFPDGSQKFRDEGRGAGVEELGEGPYLQNGQSTDQFREGANGGSIGYNPVKGGDESYKGTGSPGKQKSSTVLIHHVEAASAYNKVQPKLWDLDNQDAQMYMEDWLTFDPSNSKAFRMHQRWSMFRTDAQSNEYPTPRDQEAPCAYLTPDFNQYFVCWGQPYTNADLHAHTIDPSTQQQPVYSTEGAIYAYSASRNKWLALYTPYGQFSAGVFNFPFGGQPDDIRPESFQAGYINVKYSMSLDKNGVYDFDAGMVVGNSLAEVRNWVYNQPRMSGLPEYKFNAKSRLMWHLHHSQDQLESNITDGLVVTPIAKRRTQYGTDMKAKSPHVWTNGRVVKHIYLKAGISSHNGNMYIGWKKVGDNNEYRHAFGVSPNGSVQVYDIDLSNDPNWNNQDIMQFWIGHDGDAQAGERYNIKWVGWKNLD